MKRSERLLSAYPSPLFSLYRARQGRVIDVDRIVTFSTEVLRAASWMFSSFEASLARTARFPAWPRSTPGAARTPALSSRSTAQGYPSQKRGGIVLPNGTLVITGKEYVGGEECGKK